MFLGGDPLAMTELGHQLRAIAAHATNVADDVIWTEQLAQISTHAVGLIDGVEDPLRIIGWQLQRSADELARFRLPLERHEQSAIPPPGAPAPIVAATLVESPSAQAEFALLADALGSGLRPGPAGIDAASFPAGYVDWVDANDAVVAAHTALVLAEDSVRPAHRAGVLAELRQTLAERVGERSALPFDASLRELGVDTSSVSISITPVMAAVLAAKATADSSQLLGRHLAGRAVDAELPALAQLLVGDAEVALSWFNAHGADGLVAQMHGWAVVAPLDLERALPDISRALAVASHDPRLGFGGDDLVDADLPLVGHLPLERGLGDGSDFHIELALLASGFDATFALSAAGASFARTSTDVPRDRLFSPVNVDRRLTAMQMLIDNGLVAAFVKGYSPGDLAAMLNPPAHGVVDAPIGSEPAFGAAHPIVGDGAALPIPTLPIPTLFVATLVSDAVAARAVLVALAEHPTASQRIEDVRIADGLDIMLAGVALNFVTPADRLQFDLVHRQVLAGDSGAGILLAARGPVIEAFTVRVLADRVNTVDDELQTLAAFVAQVRTTHHRAQLDAASDGAGGVDHLLKLAGLGTSAVGVGTLAFTGPAAVKIGAAATVAGALVAVLGLGPSKRDPRLAAVVDLGVELTEAGFEAAAAFVRGAVLAGRVRDASGDVVLDLPILTTGSPEVILDSIEGLTINGDDLERWAKAHALDVTNAFAKAAAHTLETAGAS